MISDGIAVIPARGGSKGLPGKNLINLAGKPLLYWSIRAALEAENIKQVFVTSDDDAILDIARDYGATPIQRPPELARDSSPTAPAVAHLLESVGPAALNDVKYCVLLQPTSPLRTGRHIDEAFHVIEDDVLTDSVISVKQIDNAPLKAFVLDENDYILAAFKEEFPFARRQDLPSLYEANGAIYIIEIAQFLEKRSFLTPRTKPYFMSPFDSVDIDSIDDLKLAESRLASQ